MDKDKKDEKKSTSGGSGLGFGTEIILFLVVIFIIWILTGGPEKPVSEELLIKETTTETSTSRSYYPAFD